MTMEPSRGRGLSRLVLLLDGALVLATTLNSDGSFRSTMTWRGSP